MTSIQILSPEERAEKLLRYMASLPDVPDVDATLAVFASAIKDAEDAAYERAAKAVDGCEQPEAHFTGHTYWCTHVDALDEAASAVRSLKSQEPA